MSLFDPHLHQSLTPAALETRGLLLPWVLRNPSVYEKLAGWGGGAWGLRGSNQLDKCDPYKGGLGGGTLMHSSPGQAGSSCHAGHMEASGHLPTIPASRVFPSSLEILNFRPWGGQVGPCPVQRLPPAPTTPHTQGPWRRWGQSPRAIPHPGPGPRIRRLELLASVTQDVRVRVYVCAYFADLFGKCGDRVKGSVWAMDIQFSIIQQRKESGGPPMGGISVLSMGRTGSPGWGLADRLLPDFSVLGRPHCWWTFVYVPHLGSSWQRGHCRWPSQVWFLISVKQVETLPCVHVWFVCAGEHIGVCMPCFPVFSPPSDMPFRTNVRDSLPLPPRLPGPLQERQNNPASSPSPGCVFI